jgi:cyclopropane fatty-acyl-phospholipid synthase-like methyltransferase
MIIPIYVYILFFLLVIFIIYIILIKTYFRKNNHSISYNFLKTMINYVSVNNHFMNYGLWDENTTTLIEANNNLVNFVFDKSGLDNKTNMNILDVGCGYGAQDIEWSNRLDSTCQIKAFDISEDQIYHALSKKSKVMFEVCDVKYMDLKYKNELFDIIFSLESAFHYPQRNMFLKNTNDLLKTDGKFIITDIMLTKNYNDYDKITQLFIYFFSDFLYIPTQNLISGSEWETCISSYFIIEESIDITDKTFKPYYTHFVNTYIQKKGLPIYIASSLSSFFCKHQPFSYKVAVCRKK